MSRDGRRRGPGGNQGQPRPIQISKALSRLLRHSAQQDRIPIDNRGYVRMDHVLGWGKLKGMKAEAEEVVGCVGESEKMRFGLLYDSTGGRGKEGAGGEDSTAREQSEGKDAEPAAEVVEETAEVDGDEAIAEETLQTRTQRALLIFENGEDTNPRHFFIRANQGHSMRGVEAEELLTEITIDSLSRSAANGDAQGQSEEWQRTGVVVHGTFYGAWEKILKEGGVRRMGRNHVHFSTGPSAEDVLRALEGERGHEEGMNPGAAGKGKGKGNRLSKLMDESKVVSGMRRDAEVLIYVDIRTSLQEKNDAEGMRWWRSENGVILTEGKGEEGAVGMEYCVRAIEVKEGLGVLWEDGVVKRELPERLRGMAMPMGKRGGWSIGGGGRGGRPERGKGKGEVVGD